MDIGIKVNDTDGQGSNDSLAGLVIDVGAGDGYICGIVFLINGVGAGEAGRILGMGQFPMVKTVKVNTHGNGLNGFNIGSLQIHPVQGAAVQTVKRCIFGHELNGGSVHAGPDFHQTDHDSLVAGIVLNLEPDTVDTVSHSHFSHVDTAVAVSCIDLNTVHIRLGGCCIQTGCVGLCDVFRNGCLHGQDVVGQDGGNVLLQYDSGVVYSGGHCGELGSLTVVNSIGEVCGDVVNVNGLRPVDGAVGLPQIIGICMGKHELNEAEVVRIALARSIADAVGCVHAGNHDLIIGADVHGEIFPAGFIPFVVNFGLVDNRNGIFLVELAVTVGIVPVQHADPAVLKLIGDICPETDGFGVFHDHRFVQEQIELTISAGGDTGSGYGVHVQTHGALAVMYLAVLTGGNAHFLYKTLIISVNIAGVPDVKVFVGLEVKQYLGTLAQAHGGSCNQTLAMVQGSGNGAGNVGRRFGNGGKHEAVKGAKGLVGKFEGDVAFLQHYFDKTVIYGCDGLQTDFLAVGDGHLRLTEGQAGGDHDLYRALADNLIVIDHLCGCGADSTVGHEDAVFDGTHVGFLKLPGGVLGDLRLGTDKVSTQSAEGHGAAGGVVVIFNSDVCTGKYTVCGGSRYYQNAMGGGALCTVGGRAVDLDLLTGALGQECGRTAAVTVDSLYTAQLDHQFGHLVAVKACGIGRLTTVVHDHDYVAVGLDADEGTGRGIAGMVLRILVHAVLHQETEVCGDYLLFPAGQV